MAIKYFSILNKILMMENQKENKYSKHDEEAKKVEDAVKSSVLNIMQHTSLFKIPEENLRATCHAKY
jgi:hypothetical protein